MAATGAPRQKSPEAPHPPQSSGIPSPHSQRRRHIVDPGVLVQGRPHAQGDPQHHRHHKGANPQLDGNASRSGRCSWVTVSAGAEEGFAEVQMQGPPHVVDVLDVQRLVQLMLLRISARTASGSGMPSIARLPGQTVRRGSVHQQEHAQGEQKQRGHQTHDGSPDSAP